MDHRQPAPGRGRATGGSGGAPGNGGRAALGLAVGLAVSFLVLPLASVFLRLGPPQLLAGLRTPVAHQALVLSLQTSAVSLLVILAGGTPLAWWLARSDFPGKALLGVALQLPVVAPASVAGVGLLLVFGRAGLLGEAFTALGAEIPFSAAAVVLAQVFVAAPFFVIAARQAFEGVDDELIAVSRTLGVGVWPTFRRVVLPLALPGLVSGAALSLARALGEFGATIMFAGNLTGRTQTLPLAVYTVMQSDLDVAVALSVLLLSVAFTLLLLVGEVRHRSPAAGTGARGPR